MAYRDAKVIFVLLVRYDPQFSRFVTYPEDQPENILDKSETLLKAIAKADQFIAGFMLGYDQGWDTGHECCGTWDCGQEPHKRVNIEERASRWHQRSRRRGTPLPSQYRDRANGSGAGEGVGQD